MKIATTFANEEIFQHFGHCQTFKFYEVCDGEITATQIINPTNGGHGALSGFLKENGADVLICGGIGGGARTALAEAGIELYPGVAGIADECVKAFIKGELQFDPDTMCNHHDHEDGHDCGEEKHGCHNH